MYKNVKKRNIAYPANIYKMDLSYNSYITYNMFCYTILMTPLSSKNLTLEHVTETLD